MDSLCEQMDYSQLKWKPSFHLITDLNVIIKTINNKNNLISIYNICIECNNDLSWNTDKFITILDYNWLIQHGLFYINYDLRPGVKLDRDSFSELIDLFKLQIE